MTEAADEGSMTGCRHCKPAAERGPAPAVMHRVTPGPGTALLYRCRHCGSYWHGTSREMRTLSEAGAARTYPHAFRGGRVRGPSLVVLQETLLSLRKSRRRHVTDAFPPPSAPIKAHIDTDSGALVAAEGTITASSTKTQFLMSPLFDMGGWTNERDGWYAAGSIRLNLSGEEFGASVLFRHEQVHSIGLWIEDPQYGTSWNDYTEEKELARKARHETWLNANVPDWRQEFRWGAIWSGFDTKGGFSSILIQYHEH